LALSEDEEFSQIERQIQTTVPAICLKSGIAAIAVQAINFIETSTLSHPACNESAGISLGVP